MRNGGANNQGKGLTMAGGQRPQNESINPVKFQRIFHQPGRKFPLGKPEKEASGKSWQDCLKEVEGKDPWLGIFFACFWVFCGSKFTRK
jgi:hypothetical protein